MQQGYHPAIRYNAAGILVMDYIAATTLDEAAVRSKLVEIVALIKRCHKEIPTYLRGASLVFWVFHVIRDYAATLREAQSCYTSALTEFIKTAEQLEKAAAPFDIVFGHNDLLAANILDDGERLWLIDWEYAGFNTPLFDLGGLASNNSFSTEQEHELLETYFQTQVDDQLWHRYMAMKTASLLRETLWSMVSEVHSAVDFDYSAYTQENLNRYQACLVDYRQT